MKTDRHDNSSQKNSHTLANELFYSIKIKVGDGLFSTTTTKDNSTITDKEVRDYILALIKYDILKSDSSKNGFDIQTQHLFAGNPFDERLVPITKIESKTLEKGIYKLECYDNNNKKITLELQLKHSLIYTPNAKNPNKFDFYVVGHPLGKGGFATVIDTVNLERGRDKFASNKNTVLKSLTNKRDLDLFKKEAEILPKLPFTHSSPMITLQDTYLIPQRKRKGSTIADYISKLGNGIKQDPEKLFTIAINTSLELQRVFKLGMLHRDLKPQNFLLDFDTLKVRIIDFGNACCLEKNCEHGKACNAKCMENQQSADMVDDAWHSPLVRSASNQYSHISEIHTFLRIILCLFGKTHDQNNKNLNKKWKNLDSDQSFLTDSQTLHELLSTTLKYHQAPQDIINRVQLGNDANGINDIFNLDKIIAKLQKAREEYVNQNNNNNLNANKQELNASNIDNANNNGSQVKTEFEYNCQMLSKLELIFEKAYLAYVFLPPAKNDHAFNIVKQLAYITDCMTWIKKKIEKRERTEKKMAWLNQKFAAIELDKLFKFIGDLNIQFHNNPQLDTFEQNNQILQSEQNNTLVQPKDFKGNFTQKFTDELNRINIKQNTFERTTANEKIINYLFDSSKAIDSSDTNNNQSNKSHSRLFDKNHYQQMKSEISRLKLKK